MTHAFSSPASLGRIAVGVGVATWVLLLACPAQAEIITWQRAAEAENTQAAAVVPPVNGQVLLTRVEPSAPTPQEIAANAALAEARRTRAETQERITQLQAEQQQLAETNRTFAELQGQLAQARAEKEALSIAQTQATTTTAAAEARLREETRRELASTSAQTNIQLAALKDTTRQVAQANIAATNAKLEAIQQSTAEAIKAQTLITGVKFDSLQSTTDARLASMESLTSANRALASAQIDKVTTELRSYADTQLAGYTSAVSASLAEMAGTSRQQTAALQAETANRLRELYANATTTARQLAEEKAGTVATAVAKLQAETEAKRLTPEQVQVIAANTVADATPEFQALAINTLRDAKGYIRSIARGAVQEGDPAMNAALDKAAARVITSDGKVAFAIRKAVVEELNNATEGAISTTAPLATRTRLGNVDMAEPAAGPDESTPGAKPVEEVALDASRLRLARLLAPRLGPTTPEDNPTAQASLARPYANGSASLSRDKNRTDLMNIRQYRVVVHEDHQTLPDILGSILTRAAPFAGPWEVKWKLGEENKDLTTEKFSLDAETTFDEFISYLAQYMLNDRGVKLTFSLFDRERVMLVSD